MLVLRGPTKVDLIFFDEPHAQDSPWVVTPETRPQIDRHFWDWIWWLATKDQRGKDDLVREELEKLSRFLLGPLGVERTPADIGEAVRAYTGARDGPTARLGGELEAEVRLGLRTLGYDV
jgi:hypothetical protein